MSKTTFEIEQVHRFADKSNVSAKFSFETSFAGLVSQGGRITLTYPSGFFREYATPTAKISGGANGSRRLLGTSPAPSR